jgi:hypothetical protein
LAHTSVPDIDLFRGNPASIVTKSYEKRAFFYKNVAITPSIQNRLEKYLLGILGEKDISHDGKGFASVRIRILRTGGQHEGTETLETVHDRT